MPTTSRISYKALFEIRDNQTTEEKENYRKEKRIARLGNFLRELELEREEVLRYMEADPDIEIEGGTICDMYGEKLDLIDTRIQQTERKIKSLTQII